MTRIIGIFSERVDLLLEDAAAKLNLKSLLLLIEELCQLCHVQLSHLGEDNIRFNLIQVFLKFVCSTLLFFFYFFLQVYNVIGSYTVLEKSC